MKVYVAGRFSTYERCREVMDRLTDDGHTITHDWTRTDEFVDGHPVAAAEDNGLSLPSKKQQEYATDDLEGAMAADVFLLLADTALYGALIEAGAALATKSRLIVVNPARHSIFWYLPGVTIVPDVESAILLVNRISDRQDMIRDAWRNVRAL